MSARENEAQLMRVFVSAVEQQRPPADQREADLFRFAAQLLKTSHPQAAAALQQGAQRFYALANATPKPFPQMVADGLVTDVPRFRHHLENHFRGVRAW